MEILNKEYITNLMSIAIESLNKTFNFQKANFSNFDMVNSFLINRVLNSDRTNLLITIPIKDRINDFLLPTILTTTLHCLAKNNNSEIEIEINDILALKEDGTISTVKEVNEISIRILPLGTRKRINLENLSKYVLISQQYADRLESAKYSKVRIKNFAKDIHNEITNYTTILSYFNRTDIQIPLKNKNKVVIVATKNEIFPKIPKYIPFQYINKNGKVDPDTNFDPLLIVVNDFNTVKENFIEKGIPIDTIVFIGNTKYKESISAISKAYRQQKFNHCVFIGTESIEKGENFNLLKWNWTLPEIKFFNQQQYQNLTSEIAENPDLSDAILKFTNFIDETEKRYQNLINLKRLLKFIRRVYPITAINNKDRIREKANEVYERFKDEAEEIFQEEYYNIDIDYKEDLEKIKPIAQNIIELIKNNNTKANWLKQAKDIDYIVVPKAVKNYLEKEIQNAIISTQKKFKINSLEYINLLNNYDGDYLGLKNTKIITVSEFFKEKYDKKKTYLFISLFNNGLFADILLKKILSSHHKTKILCYREEAKIIQRYLDDLHKEHEKELCSFDREQLCNIKYSQMPNINSENIDEWIKHLIELDEQQLIKTDEQQFEIVFEDGDKIKERESRKVYVEGYDELYKQICELKAGDKVRIYHNPDKEVLHDIIKLTDENELFDKVDYFSGIWKRALREYSFIIDDLFAQLCNNGLSVNKATLDNWLKQDSKIKFPKEKRDLLAIIKTVQNKILNENISKIIALKKEYNGRLNKAGREFSDEIDHYILTKEKGKMLNWLSDEQIEQIVSNGSALRTIKSIKLIEGDFDNEQ